MSRSSLAHANASTTLALLREVDPQPRTALGGRARSMRHDDGEGHRDQRGRGPRSVLVPFEEPDLGTKTKPGAPALRKPS